MDYGYGVPSGAIKMSREAQAAVDCRPDLTAASTDVENAFGEARRVDGLRQVVEHFSEAAPFLAAMWGVGGTIVWIRTQSGWGSFRVCDGLYQGEVWSTLLFCLIIGTALQLFTSWVSMHQFECYVKSYIDDMVHFVQRDFFWIWSQLLSKALATVSRKLKQSKCKALIPSALQGDLHGQVVEAGMVQVEGRLPILGSAVDCVFETQLTSIGVGELSEAAAKRLAKADDLRRTLITLLDTPLKRPAKRASWQILSRVLNCALDFDTHVTDFSAFADIVSKFAEDNLCMMGRTLSRKDSVAQ